MKLDLSKKLLEFLSSHPEEKFVARDIAEWIFENNPKAIEAKRKRSTAKDNKLDDDKALIQQLVAEIGSQRPRIQKKHPNIKTTEERPKKYYFTQKSDEDEVLEAEQQIPQTTDNDNYSEHDLYPLLMQYLVSDQNIYCKRIDEKRSKNIHGANGNEWLYPDIVGMEDLSRDWHDEIKQCSSEHSDKKTKLWSFEVKVLINRSNVRKSFFQAVSNSSWSNYGYLVASRVEGADTVKELRMLCKLHGIGFIRLNPDNPPESEFLIPAQEKQNIDWDTANRLTEANKDFRDYVENIRQFYRMGKVKESDWDSHLPN